MGAGYPGVILAGGQATRMGGGDKGMLDLHGKTMLEHVIARLSPQVSRLAINANGAPERFAALSVPVLADPVPDFPGPLAGVLAAMEWAVGQGAELVLTVAADTPFFPADLAARLAQARGPSGLSLAATPNTNGGIDWHPTFGLWPVSLRHDLREALQDGKRKVLAWADRHNATAAIFVETPDPFFNVNTPEDLALARQRAARA